MKTGTSIHPIDTAAFVAVIVSGGTGRRFGSSKPKQFSSLADQTVLSCSVNAFCNFTGLQELIIVSHPDWLDETRKILKDTIRTGQIKIVAGGEFRQDSSRLGLEAITSSDSIPVLIHDAVRPWISTELIHSILAAVLSGCCAVIPVLSTHDSMVMIRNGIVTEYIDRSEIGHVQTPQGFFLNVIRKEHRRAFASGKRHFTDDASLMLAGGYPVMAIPGDPLNKKITVPGDLNSS